MYMSDQASSNSKPKDFSYYISQIDKYCDLYLIQKAPFSLPENWKEIIVKIIPWLNILMVVLFIVGVAVFFGLGVLVASLGPIKNYAMYPLYNVSTIFAFAFTVTCLVLLVKAAPGLFKRKSSAWTLMFYYQLISGVQGLLSEKGISSLFGFVVGMYVLYQVRSKYTN